MPTIKFLNEKKTVECEAGANLRSVAMREGVNLYAGIDRVLNCKGLGGCATCTVHVKKGGENCNKPGFLEWMRLLLGPLTFFARIGHEKELRLACKTRVNGDIEVETQPPLNWHGEKFWG